MKFIVAQKGAREHFLAARVLRHQGMLAQMIVDWHPPVVPYARLLCKLPCGPLNRALTAKTDDLPSDMIAALNWVGAKQRLRLKVAMSFGSVSKAILKGDIEFASSVARMSLPSHDAFFGYSYASLEALREEKRKGKFCVLDQIDPGEKEHEIIREEESRWPGFAVHPHQNIPRAVYERLHEEWRLADVILVNSEWSRQCNLEKGAPVEKMAILPLAYETKSAQRQLERQGDKNGIARVLWIGRITLQKGIQYLIEAAKLLVNEPVVCLIAGEAAISRAAMRAAPQNMKWLGKVTNMEKERLYSSSTVFVLPTLSDGFALTQLEAFAHGLPVIATPNCGSVVEDGRTGFIIPSRDPQSLTEAILRFVRQPRLAKEMAVNCREAVKAYSIDAYGRRLVDIIKRRQTSLEVSDPPSSGVYD